MAMKVFQLNNYFFLINVNLPLNLYLFFDNIQFGNLFKLLEFINPLSFMANDTCREFEEKLLALNKTCQLFKNAGPHMFWFGLSGIIKLVLEGIQWFRERQGLPRGKLYEFLKLKFGKRYFIELLSYFHMDLILYNLMNLLFSEMDNFTTFFNLFMSVVLIVFFIYFYIMLFVIVSEYSADFILSSLCDPLNRLGTVKEKAKGNTDEQEDLIRAKTKFIGQPGNAPRRSTKNMDPRKSAKDKNDTDKDPASLSKPPEERKVNSWNMRRLFDEAKLKKFRVHLAKLN